MPLYEYRCRRCSRRFEALVMGTTGASCPGCGGADLEKLFSTFAVGHAGGRSAGPEDSLRELRRSSRPRFLRHRVSARPDHRFVGFRIAKPSLAVQGAAGARPGVIDTRCAGTRLMVDRSSSWRTFRAPLPFRSVPSPEPHIEEAK